MFVLFERILTNIPPGCPGAPPGPGAVPPCPMPMPAILLSDANPEGMPRIAHTRRGGAAEQWWGWAGNKGSGEGRRKRRWRRGQNGNIWASGKKIDEGEKGMTMQQRTEQVYESYRCRNELCCVCRIPHTEHYFPHSLRHYTYSKYSTYPKLRTCHAVLLRIAVHTTDTCGGVCARHASTHTGSACCTDTEQVVNNKQTTRAGNQKNIKAHH